MCYREYDRQAVPERLLTLLEVVRTQMRDVGRGASDLRRLGTGVRPAVSALDQLDSSSLQGLIDTGELRLRADDDACASFKYGSWSDRDAGLHGDLCREIDGFMPGASPSGFFWYPTGGYMGWHTNANRPGERFFATYVEEGGRSFFRYRDPGDGRVHTSWDRDGWTFRRFLVGAHADDALWHCVFSEVERMSFGFYAPSAAGDAGVTPR